MTMLTRCPALNKNPGGPESLPESREALLSRPHRPWGNFKVVIAARHTE